MGESRCVDCGMPLEPGTKSPRCPACRIARKRQQRYESAVRWAQRIVKEQEGCRE